MAWLPLLFLVLPVFVLGQDRNLQWSSQCFDQVHEPVGTTLKLMYHNWDSHNAARWVLAILLKEKLGYDVEFYANPDSTYTLYQKIAEGHVDIDPEAWAASKAAEYDKWIADRKIVKDYGFLGTIGVEGFFVGTSLVEDQFSGALEYYKSYLREDIFEHVFNITHFSSRGGPRYCDSEGGSSGLSCNYSFPCNDDDFPQWECQNGIWFSDACCDATTTNCAQTNLSHCVEFLHANPSWTTGVLEQMLQNNNIPAGIVYGGSSATHQQIVEERFENNEPAIFYTFYPDPWLTRLKSNYGGATNMLFPSWNGGCYENATTTPDGDIDCAIPNNFLHKAATATLAKRAPNANHLLNQFTLESDDYDFMFTLTNNGSTTQHAACEWAKQFVLTQPTRQSEWIHVSRTYFPTIDKPTSAVCTAIAVFGILINCCCLVVFYNHRDQSIVVNNNLSLSAAELFGFSLMCSSAILVVSEPTNLSCGGFVWTLVIGYCLSFSILCVRTWRVKKLFHNKKLQHKSITVQLLGRNVAIVTSIVVLLLTIMQAVRPVEVQEQSKSNDWRVVFLVCGTASNSPTTIILAVYLAVLSIYGLSLAIQVADVPSRFNESRSIGMSVYNVILCVTVGSLLRVMLLNHEGELLAYATSLVILFASMGAVLIQYGYKVLVLVGVIEEKPESKTGKHRVGDIPNSQYSRNPTLEAPCDECKVLRRKIDELREKKGMMAEVAQVVM